MRTNQLCVKRRTESFPLFAAAKKWFILKFIVFKTNVSLHTLYYYRFPPLLYLCSAVLFFLKIQHITNETKFCLISYETQPHYLFLPWKKNKSIRCNTKWLIKFCAGYNFCPWAESSNIQTCVSSFNISNLDLANLISMILPAPPIFIHHVRIISCPAWTVLTSSN